MSGWGALAWQGSAPERLQKVYVPAVSNEECAKAYNNIRPNKICAGEEGRDSCQGLCSQDFKIFLSLSFYRLKTSNFLISGDSGGPWVKFSNRTEYYGSFYCLFLAWFTKGQLLELFLVDSGVQQQVTQESTFEFLNSWTSSPSTCSCKCIQRIDFIKNFTKKKWTKIKSWFKSLQDCTMYFNLIKKPDAVIS